MKKEIILIVLVFSLFAFIPDNAESFLGVRCTSEWQCNAGEQCDRDLEQCIPLSGAENFGGIEGDSCNNRCDCHNGYECSERTCTRLSNVGEQCSQNSQCFPNLLCKNRICTLQNGTQCLLNRNCFSNYCNNNRCSENPLTNPPTPLRMNGQLCDNSEQCQSSICRNNICTAENCNKNSRSGIINYGCLNDNCNSHSECASENFCSSRNTCESITGDRCINNNDCVNNNECYRGYCQISRCDNSAQCGNGRICSENRCVESQLQFCDNRLSVCPAGFSCSNNKCIKTCTSDFNCNLFGENPETGRTAEVCANRRCSSLCNQNFDNPYQIFFNSVSNSYTNIPLKTINPYLFKNSLYTIDLRTNKIIKNNDNTIGVLTNSIAYTGNIFYNDGDYKIIITNSRVYVVLPNGGFRDNALLNSDEFGVYSGNFVNLEDGTSAEVQFNIESRTLYVKVEGLTISVRMTPNIVYKFDSGGWISYIWGNNCNIAIDCMDNSHCREDETCQNSICLRNENPRNINPLNFGGILRYIDPSSVTGFNVVNNCEANSDCDAGKICNANVC